MSGRHQKIKGFSRSKIVLFGEYGLFLAIIPGTIVSILTGQVVFAISPIMLSLWLNLIRRSDGDHSNYQRIAQRDQKVVHRFDSVVERVRNDRADFLMAHAGQLGSRDQPQCVQVLDSRLACIEQQQDSLLSYLQGSVSTLVQDISMLETQYMLQRQQVEHLYYQSNVEFGWDAELLSNIYEQCESLSVRVEQLEMTFPGPYTQTLQRRLSLLQSSLEKFESGAGASQQSRGSELLKFWTPIKNDLTPRVDSLSRACESGVSQVIETSLTPVEQELETCVEQMHQLLSESLASWETLTREQGYTLQRQQEKIQEMQSFLEGWSPFESSPPEDFMGDVIEQCSLVDSMALKVARDLERVKQNLADLQIFYDSHAHVDPLVSIHQSIEYAVEKIQVLSAYPVDQSPLREGVIEQAKRDSQPLFQRLNDCDHRLTELLKAFSDHAIANQVAELRDQIQSLSTFLDSALKRLPSDKSDLGKIDVQLSMLRVKSEEVNTSIALGLQQIPYQVESHIRNKFSGQAPSITPFT